MIDFSRINRVINSYDLLTIINLFDMIVSHERKKIKMTRNDLVDITYPSEMETNLKEALKYIVKKKGRDEAIYTLAYKNTFFLMNLGINNDKFNQILFKNYLLFINNQDKSLNMNSLEEYEKRDINLFNNLLNEGAIEEAFEIYSNNQIIYHALCSSYFKDLYDDNISLINGINDDDISNVFYSADRINNTKLTVKKSNRKVYQRVSER